MFTYGALSVKKDLDIHGIVDEALFGFLFILSILMDMGLFLLGAFGAGYINVVINS